MFKKLLTSLMLLIVSFYATETTFAQESTSSADSVREKVKEKIEEALNRPKAYLGTITDKTEDTLQIKNLKGEIQFVSAKSENTSFASVRKTSKTIKYDDIAIGDFTISMGYISTENETKDNGNSVLEAKRILVTEAIEPTTRKIIFGSVNNIDNKILTISSEGGEMQFEFPKSWKGPEIDEISESNRVAVVSIPENGKMLIRTIEIIEGNQVSPTPEEE